MKNNVKCKKHPTYKVIHQPKCNCKQCWKMWNDKQRKQEVINLCSFDKNEKE